MRYVVSAAEMKQIDRYTMEKIGIPSMVLMERAAWAVTEELKQAVPGEILKNQLSVILCGTGNNGADGLAVARMLHIMGARPVICVPGQEIWKEDPIKATEEWHSQYNIVSHLRIPFCETGQFEEWIKENRVGLIVDALFGIGLTRDIDGEQARVIMLANQSDAFRAAVDIPSGVSADNGHVCQTAFRADLTVTFGCVKLGCILYPGAYFCGRVAVRDIGFPEEAFDAVHPLFITRDPGELNDLLPARPAHGHKGTFGKLVIIAGSVNMSGAAQLAALAAYRMGTGLVRIVTPEENRVILQAGLPEAILTTYDTKNVSASAAVAAEAVKWADAVVAGPGMGRYEYAEHLVRTVLEEASCPVLFDADALRMIGEKKEYRALLKKNHVLTPHLGEMSALTGRTVAELEKDPAAEIMKFCSETHACCVLKGARTFVAQKGKKHDYVNTTGNSGMASAGAGDVLSGMIGALLAQGMDTFQAACTGVLVHGYAGDLAAKKKGERALMASDIAEAACLIR